MILLVLVYLENVIGVHCTAFCTAAAVAFHFQQQIVLYTRTRIYTDEPGNEYKRFWGHQYNSREQFASIHCVGIYTCMYDIADFPGLSSS